MQSEESTKGERDRRLLELHCAAPAPAPAPATASAPAPGECVRGSQGKQACRRRMRLVAVCVGAAATLSLAALVIISVYDYWPRASLRPQHARSPARAPNSMEDGRAAAVEASARGGYDKRREDVARTPFLVNALQEDRVRRKPNSAAPIIPRPFFYRPSGPTSGPFGLQAPQSPLPHAWIERYRSAQRLKNLEHVVQYLQRNARAQVADLVPSPSDRLAFTGTWYNDRRLSEPSAFESSGAGSGDPLRGYRPHHPGDVNLLAEEPLRFSLQPAETVSAASFHRVRFPPRRICYGSRCPSCNSLGDHFHPLLPPETGEAGRINPSLFKDVTPEERPSSVSNRKVVRPSFLQKPRFRPIVPFLSEDFMLHRTVRPLLPNRDIKSRFHYAIVTTSTTISPPIHPTNALSDFDASASNNYIAWHSRSEVTMTSPSLNSSPSSVMKGNYTLPKTTPPSKSFLFTNMLNTAKNADDLEGSILLVPTRIPNEPEIIQFKAEDAKVHKSYSKMSVPQLIESSRNNLVESIITARKQSTDTGGRVAGDELRNERGSTATHAPSTPTTTATMKTAVTHAERDALVPQINGHYRSLYTHSPLPPEPPQNASATVTPTSENISSVTVSPTTTAEYGYVEETLRPKYVAIDRSMGGRTSTVTPYNESLKDG